MKKAKLNYFVTGATGFLGRFLVARLLQRGGTVHVLVRKQSAEKFDALKNSLQASDEALLPVYGDITQPGLVSTKDAARLKGKIDHVFHSAGAYDMNMDDATGNRVNTEGTRNVVAFVNKLGGPVRLHHISSIVVAGRNFDGTFSEKMFDEGQSLDHPYVRTKFESEKIVREECKAPWRVYRPAGVVGSSETGEMDKVDGPYFLFKTIQRVRDTLPKWLPILGIEGGFLPIAPVDYVVAAMDHIAHVPGLDGQAFHLLQSPQDTMGDLFAILLKAAHGPEIARRIKLPPIGAVKLIRGRLEKKISQVIGMPLSLVAMIDHKTIYDDKQARAALKGSGIVCPKLANYADKLWDYWELCLD